MKVGLFFGSFNPLHIGHMAIAQYMVEFTDLEQVWFVVSPQNPFKEKSSLLDQHHRLMMVRIATEDHPQFQASNIEFNLSQPSYTVDTLTYLNEVFIGIKQVRRNHFGIPPEAYITSVSYTHLTHPTKA